ncbi:MAG: N-acetylmuramoyl-L-alanine amidase [Clostridia bacterium]|nr:N-acetylmuramoyl-L-alanine amidase [Clostridia bacterium]
MPSRIKIMLDPGHSGTNRNCSPAVPGYCESRFTWEYAKYLKKALKKTGFFDVALTRSSINDDPEVTKRGRSAKGYSLLISVHTNASADKKKDRVVVYRQIGNAPYAVTAKKFSNSIAPVLNKAMGCKEKYAVKTRKGSRGDYYGVLRGAASVGTPAVLIEHSYHTNERAATRLLNVWNLKSLAYVTCKVICGFFGADAGYPGKLPRLAGGKAVKKGAKGRRVKKLQCFLNWFGNYALEVDGSFGKKTENAVKDFQEKEGLEPDGSFGKKSLKKAKEFKIG